MITVVSGLPRSGTSLMMQILDANGFTIVADHVRRPDESNPRGYFEYEKVKSLMKDNCWMGEAEGKAIKIITQLVSFLPSDFFYHILFMERNIDEIISSQEKMLERSNVKRNNPVNRDILKKTFLQHTERTKHWIEAQNNMRLVNVSYKGLVTNTCVEIEKINAKLSIMLNTETSLRVVAPELHREKL